MILFSFCECQWWIPWLIGPILGLLAGWLLWSKYQKQARELESELSGLKTKHANLAGDLDLCRSSKAKIESDFALFRGQMRESNAPNALKAVSAAPVIAKTSPKAKSKSTAKQGIVAVGGKKQKLDDLKLVEGIGPKIEKLLKDDGIDTWRKLSNANVEDIQAILDKAGKRYQLADPGTWPKQAEMCADGRWDDLKEYQGFLKGGK